MDASQCIGHLCSRLLWERMEHIYTNPHTTHTYKNTNCVRVSLVGLKRTLTDNVTKRTFFYYLQKNVATTLQDDHLSAGSV